MPGGDPPGTAATAGSTHPTGMHSCFVVSLEMEYEHMNLENINSPDYETVLGDDYETPVEKNPQPGDRNTHVIVNLPIDKTNEKVCETIHIFNYLHSRTIYV